MSLPNGADAPGQNWPGAQRAYRGSRMPPQDVTNRELENRLIDISTAIREDMVELRGALATLMPREVYEVRHSALRETVTSVDSRLSADIAELKLQLALEKEQRRNLAKWVVGVVVIPVVLFVGQIILNMQGAGS